MDQMTRHLLIISIAVFITIITIVIKIIITPSKPRSLNTDWYPSLPPSAIYLDHHIPPHHHCCQPMYDVYDIIIISIHHIVFVIYLTKELLYCDNSL